MRISKDTARAAHGSPQPALVFLDGLAATLDALRAAGGGGTPFQAAGFVGAWGRTRGAARGRRTVALVGEAGGGFVLPLEIARRGPFRIAAFPGETHANANGAIGLLATDASAGAGALDGAGIVRAARAAGLRIDALDLRRMPELSALGRDARVRPAAEARFAMSLEGGFEAVLARGNAKRKRKKFRSQQRHFEGRGGYAFRDVPRPERAAALAVFLAQKRERFRSLQMPNPFLDNAIDEFLLALYQDGEGDARLYVVESGGVIKAMMGGLVADGTFWGMVSSFADDEDAVASPGELLLWHLVETLCSEGLRQLDLGPGEERYKLSWCDRTVPQYDVLVPLGQAGRLYATLAASRGHAVSIVKRTRA